MVGQVLTREIVEQHHRPVGGDETMPRRVVRHPQLHVGAVGGVADVDGVVEQGAGIVAALQLGADALQPVLAHFGQVGCGNACRGPFSLRLGAITQHMLVERRRLPAGGIAQGLDRAGLERHDLAMAAKAALRPRAVHGRTSGPHLLAARVERRLYIDARRPPVSEDLDLEQAGTFVLGKGCRHIALRH